MTKLITDFSLIELNPEFDDGANSINVKSSVPNLRSGISLTPAGSAAVGLNIYNTDSLTDYGFAGLYIHPTMPETLVLGSRAVGSGIKPSTLNTSLSLTVPSLSVAGETTLDPNLTGIARLTSGVVSADVVRYADLSHEVVASVYNGWIGACEYPVSVEVTSNGSVVTLTVQRDPTGNLDLIFSGGIVEVDCTPPLTIALTAGSDVAPQTNYVYITKSNPTVLTKSTTGFPTNEEYFRIGDFTVQSAASVQTYGLYRAYSYSHEVWKDATVNGHISDLNNWIRRQHATYVSGVVFTPTVVIGPPDTLTVATSAGVVSQLHNTDFALFNSATAGSTNQTTFFCPNHPTPFTSGKNLNTSPFLRTSNNVAVSGNQTRISWVIWGSIDHAENSKMFVNLPSGFYTDDDNAIADPNRYTNYLIPKDYTGLGFLIAKLTYRVSSAGTLTLVENVDLRGMIPSRSAGGTNFLNSTFPDNIFSVFDETDPTKELLVSVDGNSTGVTTTLASVSTVNRVLQLPNVTDTLAVLGANTFTAPQSLSVGSVGSPSLYLDGDTTSGLYRIGANNIGVSISGSKVLDISSTGLTVTGLINGGMPAVGVLPGGSTLQRHFSTTGSAGIIDGTIAYVTPGTTSIKLSVVAGEGYLRTTNDQQGELKFISWPASTDIYTFSPPAAGFETSIFVGVEYNGGSPRAFTTTSFTQFNGYDNFWLARCSYDGTTVRILNTYAHSEDIANNTRLFLRVNFPFHRETPPEGSGGIEVSSSLRALAVTAGKVWHGYNRYSLGPLASGTPFDLHYRQSGGGFVTTYGVTTWPNTQYDNGTGTLADMTTNRYGVLWVYIDVSDSSLDVVYGYANETSVAGAQASAQPSIPDHLSYHGALIGRIIYQKSAASATTVESAWVNTFAASTVQNHALLSSLQGGTAGEYFHLTSSEYTGTGTGTFVRAASPTITGTLTVADLVVNGTTTTINSTTLDIVDINITLAKGAPSAAFANGGGITIEGAAATMLYASADDSWNLNKKLNVGSSLSVTGNLTFSGNARRIIGDFTTATIADRPHFQTSVVDGVTSVGILPNGIATKSQFNLENNSDPTNSGYLQLRNEPTEHVIGTYARGTGSVLPIGVYISGTKVLNVASTGLSITGTSSVTGVASFAAGAVGAPSLYLSTDTTTGLYRPSANTLGFTVSGTQRYLIHSTGATLTGNLDLTETQDYQPQVIIRHNGSTVGSAGYLIARRSRAASTTVLNGDTLGTLMFQGHDGTGWVNGSYVECGTDGVVSTGVMPTYMKFVNGTERMRIASSGTITLGGVNTSPALSVIPFPSQNQWVTITGDLNNGPRISAAGTAPGNLYLSSNGIGGIYFYTGSVGSLQFGVLNRTTTDRYITVQGGYSITPTLATLATNSGGLIIQPHNGVAGADAFVHVLSNLNGNTPVMATTLGVFIGNNYSAGNGDSTFFNPFYTAAISFDFRQITASGVSSSVCRMNPVASGARNVVITQATAAGNPSIGVNAGSLAVGLKGAAPTLRLEAMDGTNEGGELHFGGAASYPITSIDNYAGHLRMGVNSGVAFTISSTGEVGVGTNVQTLAKFSIENKSSTAVANNALLAVGNNDTNFQVFVKSGVNTAGAQVVAGVGMDYSTTYIDLATIKFWRTGGAGGELSFLTGSVANGTERMRIDSLGNVGIGMTPTASFKLEVNGAFAATTKSFVIKHPTKPNKRLVYGSLEGPENGVYVRGKTYVSIIELPEYWTKLVDPESITVQLTAFGNSQKLCVEKIENNRVHIRNDNILNKEISCFYFIQGERVDVAKLEVEPNV